ncbi:MAG: hypothetical protein U1E51_17215 [Candidatus Binatia bacterium]|nr:hypothetical protein [Candidatus Binatia bacterium]
MTLTKNLAFTVFGAYVAFGPGIYTSGKTEVSGLGYVRYEKSPPNEANPTHHLFRLSTQINSGSAAAFIYLTNSL